MLYAETVTIGRRSIVTRIWEGLKVHFEIIGYSRAAAHLASQGLYEESKACMAEVAKLKS